MTLQPSVIALQALSILVLLSLGWGAFWAWRILEGWDPESPSERQLRLEQRAWLVSAVVSRTCLAQGLSLALFLHTADSLHRILPGAMCAAGSLNANAYGYPALLMKAGNGMLCGLWLILNRADRLAESFPLLRSRCRMLLGMLPLAAFEFELQWEYFRNLAADGPVSCCDALFNAEGRSVLAWVASLPVVPLEISFFAAMALTLAAGVHVLLRRQGASLFGWAGLAVFPLTIASLIAFVFPYLYELPTHHCPFCILQREYAYIGYAIYAGLLGGTLAAAGALVLSRCAGLPGLEGIVPRMQARLVAVGLLAYGLLTAIVTYAVLFSNLVLVEG